MLNPLPHAVRSLHAVPAERPAASAALPVGAPRLLLAADDPAAAAGWSRAVSQEGWVFVRGDEADEVLPQATVLFVAGTLAAQLNHLRALRERAPAAPLLVVVRGLRDLDQVLALEMGADDVQDAALAAPVVAARLRALWRRSAAPGGGREAPRELRFGALRLQRLERRVQLGTETVPLTEGEFEVLWLLASHAGHALSRREILRQVRGLDDQPMDRSIDSRVYRIRAKLGDHESATPRIRTVRHHGYAFSPAGW